MNNIKCSQCGLVNWASATTCKRCGWQLDWQYAPPESMSDSAAAAAPEPLFSRGLTFLTAILLLTIGAFASYRVFHAIDLETAKIMAASIILVGAALMIFAHLWLVLRIFEQSAVWGLATLCVPLAGLFAVAKFWEQTRRSFVGQLLCVGIVLVGAMIVPN